MEQRFIEIQASFIDEISELFIVKMLHKKAQHTLMSKNKVVRNLGTQM